MVANATSSLKYIVLVTDAGYHEHEGGSTVWKDDVIDELTATGSCVYISLWDEEPWSPPHHCLEDIYYFDLTVNNEEFDDANYDPEADLLYPLVNLRDGILSDLGL